MEWLRSMLNAINYMEDNILKEVGYDKIARFTVFFDLGPITQEEKKLRS